MMLSVLLFSTFSLVSVCSSLSISYFPYTPRLPSLFSFLLSLLPRSVFHLTLLWFQSFLLVILIPFLPRVFSEKYLRLITIFIYRFSLSDFSISFSKCLIFRFISLFFACQLLKHSGCPFLISFTSLRYSTWSFLFSFFF